MNKWDATYKTSADTKANAVLFFKISVSHRILTHWRISGIWRGEMVIPVFTFKLVDVEVIQSSNSVAAIREPIDDDTYA